MRHSAATPPCQDPGFGEDPVCVYFLQPFLVTLNFLVRRKPLTVLNFSWPGLLRQKTSRTKHSGSVYGTCRGSDSLSHSSAEVKVYLGGMSKA